MGLRKGKTNNLKGRPKGTPNKVTTNLRERICQLIEGNMEQLVDDFEKLEPKERWALTEKLLQYIIAKKREEEIKEPERVHSPLLDRLFMKNDDIK